MVVEWLDWLLLTKEGDRDEQAGDANGNVNQTNSFRKTQSGEFDGSFNHATGVSNANAAGGNLNNQTAFTTISIGSIGH